jgi:hypothetical protein
MSAQIHYACLPNSLPPKWVQKGKRYRINDCLSDLYIRMLNQCQVGWPTYLNKKKYFAARKNKLYLQHS